MVVDMHPITEKPPRTGRYIVELKVNSSCPYDYVFYDAELGWESGVDGLVVAWGQFPQKPKPYEGA